MNLVMIFGYYWYNSTLNKIQLSKELKKCIINPLTNITLSYFDYLDLDCLHAVSVLKNLRIVPFYHFWFYKSYSLSGVRTQPGSRKKTKQMIQNS